MAKVRIKIAGMIDRKMLNRVFDEEVKDGIRVKELFEHLDRTQTKGQNYFKRFLKLPSPPVILINGEQMELKEALNSQVKDGDEIALLMPMAGG
jgi:molybdopterin converting factor small subunit